MSGLLNKAINNEINNNVEVSVDMKELLDRVAELEAENEILAVACNDRDKIIEEARVRTESLNNVVNELRAEVSTLNNDNDSLKETIKKLSANVQLREKAYTQLKDKYNALKEELNETNLALQCEADMVNELMEIKKSLEAKLNSSKAEEATTDEHTELLDDMLEEAAKEVAEESNREEVEVDIEADKDIEEDMSKVASFIANINATKIQPILNADYKDVVDTMVNSIDEVADKYISMLGKGKVKNQSENIKAAGKIKSFLKIKKEDIEEINDEEVKESLLVRLGALVKSILVKALKCLLATGKIIGKSAIVVSTLISKVVVYTVVETIKAGKAIVTIAVEDYKEAIR